LFALSSAGSAIATTAPVPTPDMNSQFPDLYAADIAEASQRFGVPEAWIRAVMRVESAGDPRALSTKGAMGLMQIMPDTYAELRARYSLGANPYAPRDNILAGAAFLRELHGRYGSPGFLAAYNAGPARYDDYLATDRPLPDETRRYVAILAPMIDGSQPDLVTWAPDDPPAWTRAALFVARATAATTRTNSTEELHENGGPSGAAVVDLSGLVPQSGDLFVRRTGKAAQP
jgi:SLT domain-containing protein